MSGLSIPPDCLEQIEDAYRTMAERVRYRPAAPSDGFGNITVPLEDLDLDTEARNYAACWWEQEDECAYVIGCPDYTLRRAMIYLIEAARMCCAGPGARLETLRLIELAAREVIE